MADGIRPPYLFRRIAQRLRMFLVRSGRRAIDFVAPSALRLRGAPVCLSQRGGDYWPGGGGCHAAGAAGGGRRRRLSKIAKATLRFENRNSAARGSVSAGTATR